jgi:hypothetical protein
MFVFGMSVVENHTAHQSFEAVGQLDRKTDALWLTLYAQNDIRTEAGQRSKL